MTSRLHAAALGCAALATALAGCAKNAGSSAEQYIVDELQEQIGLGPLEADCDQPSAYEAGETFTCTATSEDGKIVTFAGTMTDEETFDLTTTNVVSAEAVTVIRARVAEAVAESIGAPLDADDIACDGGAILLDDAGDFACEITEPETGNVFGIVISTGGLDSDGKLQDFSFQIGDEPL